MKELIQTLSLSLSRTIDSSDYFSDNKNKVKMFHTFIKYYKKDHSCFKNLVDRPFKRLGPK